MNSNTAGVPHALKQAEPLVDGLLVELLFSINFYVSPVLAGDSTPII